MDKSLGAGTILFPNLVAFSALASVLFKSSANKAVINSAALTTLCQEKKICFCLL